MNKVIVYEKINVITLIHALLSRSFYKQQYFLNYSVFIKKYCYSVVKKFHIKQIHFVNLPGSSAFPKGSEMAIELAQKIVNDNHKLSIPFIKYLNDRRSASLIKKIYVGSLVKNCVKYNALKEFVERNEADNIYYVPVEKNLIIESLKREVPNVVIIRWYVWFFCCIRLVSKIINYSLLVAAPLIITAKIIKEGRFTFYSNDKKKASKKIIFFHRNPFAKCDNSNIYRNSYYFNSSILEISDCIHSGIFNPLSPEKRTYLKDRGGLVCDYMSEKISFGFIVTRLFIDYYRCFIRFLLALAFNRSSSLYTIICIMGALDKTIMLQNLLSKIDVKLAFFESEMGLICSIFTILSDRYNIKTMTMSHGNGGYCIPDHARANMVVNYYLVQGNYYKKYFLPDNPDIKNYCLIGDIEVEPILDSKKELCKDLCINIKRDKKVVTVFVVFNLFLSEVSSTYHKLLGDLFDQEDARKALERLWKPFLEWADSQDDLFFIFKAKESSNQYEHRFMKEILSVTSREKYYQNDKLLVKELINISDCTISTGNSSTLYSALCLGKPAISYNFTVPGYVPVKDYDKHLVATSPDELISNLTYILEHGISKDVYEKARKDHYAEGNLDFKAAERIKRLTRKIINN